MLAQAQAAPLKTALVLSGGGARGAYEVGVVRYLREELPRRLGHAPRLDILCGTSVGAINVAFLAATADDPAGQAARLVERWRTLRVEQMFDLSMREVMRAGRLLLGGHPPPPHPGELRRGGLLNTEGLERLVVRSIPWRRIGANLAARHLDAVSVSATHVATGRTAVFVDRHGGGLPPWGHDPAVRVHATRLTPFHVLASAAIPVLFPAVAIDGAYHTDGGLRQNTPLTPALRLGADRALVVSLKHLVSREEEQHHAAANEEHYPNPWFLLGKTLDALLVEHTDHDLDRLHAVNALIDSGTDAFGERFLDEMNASLAARGMRPLRRVHPLLIRPSRDIAVLASQYAHTPRIADLPGLQGRLLRYLANAPAREADLLSYVLFDGDFAEALIELGYRDARAREDELVAFFSAERAPQRAVAQ